MDCAECPWLFLMSIKLLLPLTLVFFLFLYFTFFNSGSVDITVLPDQTYTLPLVVVVMASFLGGALTAFFISFFQVFRLELNEFRTKRKNYQKGVTDSRYENALACIDLGKCQDAERGFQKILKSDPHHLPSMLTLGRYYREKGETGEALQVHAQAKAESPHNLRVITELFLDQISAGRASQAVEILDEIDRQWGPAVGLWKKLRDLYVQRGLWEDAGRIQKKILRETREDQNSQRERKIAVGIGFELAVGLVRKDDRREAVSALKRLTRDMPEFVPAYVGLASIYLEMEKERDARKILQEGFQHTRSLVCLRNLESIFLRNGKVQDATRLYQDLKKIHPDDRTIRILLIHLYVEAGDLPAAASEMKDLESGVPKTTLFLLLKGLIQEKGVPSQRLESSLKEAIRTEFDRIFRYRCGTCARISSGYVARCGGCGEWNSYSFVLDE